MNGAGKQAWGWYPTGKVWVPIQVDANGKLVIDAIPNSLLTAQGDIIIRGTTIPERLAIGASGKTLRSDGSVPYWDNEEMLMDLIVANQFMIVPTNAGWGTSITGNGVVGQEPARIYVGTGTTASKYSIAYCILYALQEGADFTITNYGKKTVIRFNLIRNTSDAQHISYVRFGDLYLASEAAADMTRKGIGLKMVNLAIWAESYGAHRAVTDLSVAMTSGYSYGITIIINPGVSATWYVNGVLKLTETDLAHIPSGVGAMGTCLSVACLNGAAGVDTYAQLAMSKIWQAR